MRNQITFSLEFKRHVIEELLSGESRPAQICCWYNITSSVLYHWKRQYRWRQVQSHSYRRQRRFSRRSRRRDIEPRIESEVRQKALVEGWTAAEIHRLLLDEARDGKWEDADVPSLRTVHHQHRVLSEALKYGVRQGWLARNPCELVDPPRAKKRIMRTLIPYEIKTFFGVAKNSPYYGIFFMAVNTGLRQAELLGLRWRDVDIDMLSLSVSQTL